MILPEQAVSLKQHYVKIPIYMLSKPEQRYCIAYCIYYVEVQRYYLTVDSAINKLNSLAKARSP